MQGKISVFYNSKGLLKTTVFACLSAGHFFVAWRFFDRYCHFGDAWEYRNISNNCRQHLSVFGAGRTLVDLQAFSSAGWRRTSLRSLRLHFDRHDERAVSGMRDNHRPWSDRSRPSSWAGDQDRRRPGTSCRQPGHLMEFFGGLVAVHLLVSVPPHLFGHAGFEKRQWAISAGR